MLIIIDNYDSFTYNLYQAIANHIDTRVFRNDKITVDDIRRLNPEGIILSPGPGRPENAGICIEIVKELSSTIPILGVCLGHQAIATAFDCEVVQHGDIVHGKSSIVHHMQDELFNFIPTSFQAGRYHSLKIELKTMSAAMKILAISNDGTIMAVKHESYPCYGVQFHPESALTPEGNYLFQNFINICMNFNVGFQHAAVINQ
jgi:anthranilate synthase component 2